MSGPVPAPLQPIAEAFAAADAEAAATAQRAEAERARQEAEAQERIENEAYFKDCLRRQGAAMARKVGRAFGFDDAVMRRLIDEEEAAQAEKQGKIAARKARRKSGSAEDAPPDREGEFIPPDGDGDGGIRFTKKKDPIKPLPSDCPVIPVGYGPGTCFFLNPSRQLIEMGKGAFSAEGIRLLFGDRQDWLWSFFPKHNEKTGVQSGWKADQASESLIDAAHRAGWFDPLEAQRGLGGWRSDEGALVLHCGNAVLMDGQDMSPGKIGPYLYAAGKSTTKPAPAPENETDRARQREAINALLGLFDGWNWLDGPGSTGAEGDGPPVRYAADVDGSGHKLASLMVLGWMAAARAGGALDYRPLMWLTGDAGTGKTTLQDIIKRVLGNDLVKASDPTAAGIWQTLGLSTRPVLVDEAEPDPHSNKISAVVKLARQAATKDGLILRGSAGHASTAFLAQSAFLFSSIIVVPMLMQDISRFAVLDLGPIRASGGIKADPAQLAFAGRVIMRRLMDGWHRWPDTLEAYRQALAAEGHDPRGCDQFGTLLAAGDLMRFDELADPETRRMLAAALNFKDINADMGRENNALGMLNHLITTPLDVFRGGTRMTIGTLVAIGAGVQRSDKTGEGEASPKGAREALEAWGIFIDGFDRPDGRRGSMARVIVPNQHNGLLRLFRDTQWYGTPGSPLNGWVQAMRRLPGARPENSRRFGGRGWSVPVHVFLQSDDEVA